MEKIEGGAIIIARKIIENEIFYSKPDKWLKIFIYILCRAVFKDNRLSMRGECFLKYQWIIEATGATKDQIYDCIKWLKKNGMLTTQKTTRGIIIKVLNYDKYQNLDNYIYETKNDIKTTGKRQASDTILKKDNNIKKDKNNALQAEPAPEQNFSKKNDSEMPSARIIKPPTIIQETQSVPADQIQEIIALFRNTNPALQYNNKTERKAVADLISNSNFQEIKNLAEYAIKVREEQYAPKITTPYELWLRQTKLKSFKNTKINKITYKPYVNTNSNSNASGSKYKNAT
jgi:hypothetical protein